MNTNRDAATQTTWQAICQRCPDQRSKTLQHFQATVATSCLCSPFPSRGGLSEQRVSAPPPLSCASSLQLDYPMHYSHSLQLQVVAHCAIAHIREFFVSELEWFIVSLYRLALPCARSPRNSQSEVCEFKGYFYLLPSPILTLLPTPYHTAYSSSFHLRCNRALRSRA